MRALHTYSAMWVLILLVFFSITGITLNHPTWQSKLGRSAEFNGTGSARCLSGLACSSRASRLCR
ncbi:hypothetical protein [Alishewanella longhuensis]